MSAPGGGFREGDREDEGSPPSSGETGPQQPDWALPGDPPPADYPPPAYSPGYPAEYPPPIPPPPGYGQPPGYGPPPGYGQPPGYGGAPYPPGPPQFGGPPGGYTPPPYPGGYPGGDAGGYYPGADWPAPVQAGTNGLAIASLISSFTGFLCCFIGSIVAIVLGVIALNQIKETRQDGYGLAITGIVIGTGTLLVFLIIAMFSIHAH